VSEVLGVAVASGLGESDDCARGAEPPHAASRTATTNESLIMYRLTLMTRIGYAMGGDGLETPLADTLRVIV
jgi:hypothetical protein